MSTPHRRDPGPNLLPHRYLVKVVARHPTADRPVVRIVAATNDATEAMDDLKRLAVFNAAAHVLDTETGKTYQALDLIPGGDGDSKLAP